MKKKKKKVSKVSFIRTNIITGLLVTIPLFVTYFFLRAVVVSLDSWLISAIPVQYQPSSLFPGTHIYGLGLFGVLVLLFFAGLFARNFFGKKLVQFWEYLIKGIPGVRTVYSATKQIVDTIGQSNSKSFREVVLLEYPRKGLWSLAFVTSSTKGEVQKVTDEELVSIFLPTTPNPTSGFLLFVPKKDITVLDMSVDQGVKMVISAGIVVPPMKEKKKTKAKAKAA